MMTATRREWSELYTFFTILAQGGIAAGTAEGTEGDWLPVALVRRQEHDGERRYLICKDEVLIQGTDMDVRIPRADFATVALLVREALAAVHEDEVEAPEGVEDFLDAVKIFNLEAVTDDRTDLHVAFYHQDMPLVGLRINSRLCSLDPLLDGGRTANLKMEQTGIRFSQPAVYKINYTEDPENTAEVARRMLYIESMGGIFKFSDVCDRVFRCNLHMIDLHFPRVLCEMLRIFHLDQVSRIDELTALIEERNPLKIKDELIQKHGFYRHKMKQFLVALALGLRPAKIYTGRSTAVGGFIMVGADGRLTVYRQTEADVMADYLFTHTRLEKGLPDKDKYGYLERENKLYYFKLNLKIGFTRK